MSKSVLQSLAANIKKYRKKANLTQDRLSEMLKMDVRYLQRIEKGEINIGVELLVRCAEALSIDPGRLLEKAKLEPPKPGRPKKGAQPD